MYWLQSLYAKQLEMLHFKVRIYQRTFYLEPFYAESIRQVGVHSVSGGVPVTTPFLLLYVENPGLLQFSKIIFVEIILQNYLGI